MPLSPISKASFFHQADGSRGNLRNIFLRLPDPLLFGGIFLLHLYIGVLKKGDRGHKKGDLVSETTYDRLFISGGTIPILTFLLFEVGQAQ